MEPCFYIGTLGIVYHIKQELPLKQFDSQFLQPVLQTEHLVHVDLRWEDELTVPMDEPAQAETNTMLAWRKAGEEWRLYLRGEKASFLSSYLCASRDRICITALRSARKEIWKEFRPWFQVHLERLLLWNRALVLHSASIIYRGEAILFTAPSGTGKTTQTDLWHEFCENVSDLNGDRTVLQQTDQGWYGCGFPIYGGVVRCEQAAVPIRAIVILRQAKKDAVRELSPIEKVMDLYSECTVMRAYPEDVQNAMNLLEILIADVTVVELDCTMERSAVDVLHTYLYGECE